MWRVRFFTASDGNSCSTSNWTVSRLFQRDAGAGAIYDAPSVTKDVEGHVWVYWGTGNKADPSLVTAGLTDRVYGVEDATISGSYSLSDLENISSSTYTDNATKRGWYFNLLGSGEKCLADSSIFAGQIYFTTYTHGSMRPGRYAQDLCHKLHHGCRRPYGKSQYGYQRYRNSYSADIIYEPLFENSRSICYRQRGIRFRLLD